MEKLSFGDVATLSNNKKYTCFYNLVVDGKDFVFLMGHEQDIVKIAEQQLINDELSLRIVNDEQTKERLLKLYKQHFVDDVISKVE